MLSGTSQTLRGKSVVCSRRPPQTQVIIDHWGFFVQDGKVEEDSWTQLIKFAQYPQVSVKISAAFRNVVNKEDREYSELAERLISL